MTRRRREHPSPSAGTSDPVALSCDPSSGQDITLPPTAYGAWPGCDLWLLVLLVPGRCPICELEAFSFYLPSPLSSHRIPLPMRHECLAESDHNSVVPCLPPNPSVVPCPKKLSPRGSCHCSLHPRLGRLYCACGEARRNCSTFRTNRPHLLQVPHPPTVYRVQIVYEYGECPVREHGGMLLPKFNRFGCRHLSWPPMRG